MAKLEGVVVYTIEKDGCLNGVFTDDQVKHKIYNEIARLIEKDTSVDDKISGKYRTSWMDPNTIENGELEISRQEYFYEVSWYNSEKKRLYKGKGFITGPHQFTVAYTSA